jgi:glycosyltransferase involved in cell wall biosynthesis
MRKKKLLIIIDNLKKGGAEMLLAGILPEVNFMYDVILVTLTADCDFNENQIVFKERFVLGFKGKLSFLSCVLKLRKIIKKTAPSLIHAHLYYSSLAARLACPSNIPLIYTIHNELSKNIFDNNKLYKLAEKATIRKNHSIIAVSRLVLDDYSKTIQITQKHFILRNYISDEYFNYIPIKRDFNRPKVLRILAVGNLKASKNYEYLLQSMIGLKSDSVALDIYGNTDYEQYPAFVKLIEKYQLNVTFKGKVDNIIEAFSHYDLYAMSSSYEGFGIAAVEAMSMGLPLLLSDIPVLREVTFSNALFFNLSDPLALTKLINEIANEKHNLNELSDKGIEIAKKYTRQQYIDALFSIYENVIKDS